MGVVKGAVGCAVAALLVGHQLSSLDADRRAALWDGARAAWGAAPAASSPPRPSSAAQPVSLGEERIAADRAGQFQAVAEIEGRRIPVLVDTGATFVALSAEDADRIGVHPAAADFRFAVETANGRARVAKVQLASVRLGAVELRDVSALVSAPGQLGRTLLGMSFLSRLSGVRIDRGQLILTQ